MGSVTRAIGLAFAIGCLLGIGAGFLYFSGGDAPVQDPEEVHALSDASVPDGWSPPTAQELGAAPAVAVEVGALLSDSPGALLPAAVHELEPVDRLELSTISTFPQEALGVLLDLPFGLQAMSRTHTLVHFDFANEDGMILRATLIRWARCRPRFDRLFNLRPRIARLNQEMADPERQRLLAYLLALRMVGLDEGRGRRPHYLYDEIHVGDAVGYLRSTFGPCAQCDSGARRFELDWTVPVEGGYKDLTLLVTSNYPGVDNEMLVQMARTIRMDDSTILRCDRPEWPDDADAIVRRIDEQNLMEPGPDEAAEEWQYGADASEDPTDAGAPPASPTADGGP